MLQSICIPVRYPDIIPAVPCTVHLYIDQIQIPVSIIIMIFDAPKIIREVILRNNHNVFEMFLCFWPETGDLFTFDFTFPEFIGWVFGKLRLLTNDILNERALG
jgi:hypothetical protein